VKDNARPPASAKAPSGWEVAAAPSTIGTSGSTQGDRIESSPAASANARLVSKIGHRPLEALIEQGRDRTLLGVADGAALLVRTLEDNQSRLHLGAELLDLRLHRIEIDPEYL
jgi:regulator of protease activity HflC (stomatin/prohibitin superfamily)